MKLDLASATTQEIQTAKGLYPIAAKYYLIALWETAGQRWIIRKTRWDNLADAEQEAINVCQPRNGYTHWARIDVELPGAKL